MNLFGIFLSKKRKKIKYSELNQLNDSEFSQLREIKKNKIFKDYSKKYVGTRKFAKSVLRRLVLSRGNKRNIRRTILDKEKLLARYRQSLMLESFYLNREKKWLLLHKRKNRLPIKVNSFSFLDAPIETIEVLKIIALAEAKYDDVILDFNFEYCKDIGPFLVLGVMAKEMSPFLKGGKISSPTKKVLEAVELDKFLKMSFQKTGQPVDVWPFRLESRYPAVEQAISLTGSSQKLEKVSQRFAEALDEWISKAVKRDDRNRIACLSEEGHSQIISLIGEILDNAQRHADLEQEEAGEWHIAGFMAKRQRGDDNYDYICHVSVLNLGDSIGQTISNSKSENFILKFLKSYTTKHISHNENTERVELLNTVAALKAGISRFAEKGDWAGNGMGFVNMMRIIQYFENTDIPDLEPCVTIISGASCILFKGKYGPSNTDDEGNHYTWLNKENSKDKAPDRENAFTLPINFPGTVLSFRFNLNKNLINDQD